MRTSAKFPRSIVRSAILAAVAAAGFAGLAATAQADGVTRQRDLLPAPQSPRDEPPLPALSEAEKGYLVKLARRALEHSFLTGTVFAPTDVPDTLKAKDYVACMSVRVSGRMTEDYARVTDGGTLAENVARAAAALAGGKAFDADRKLPAATQGDDKDEAARKVAARLATVRGAVVELSVLGPGQMLPYRTVQQVFGALFPGIHGLAARLTTRGPDRVPVVVTYTIEDSVAPVNNYTAEQIMGALLKKAGWNNEQVVNDLGAKDEDAKNRRKITFFRFRSCHLLEQPGLDGYVELFRCAQLIGAEQVTGDRLNELIGLIGQYMCYRQLSELPKDPPKTGAAPGRWGMFSYCYLPTTGLYSKDDSGVHQAGAAWAMARLARISGKNEYELAALKAIGGAHLRYLDAEKKSACVHYEFDKNLEPLGSSAMMLAAMIDVPNNQPVAALRDKLAAGLLSQQQADGSFKLFFGGPENERDKFRYPGQALLALMMLYNQTADKQALAAVENAFKFYSDLFKNEPDRKPVRNLAAWHAQAWALAYQATKNKDYRDFVFQLADFLVGLQFDESREAYPDMLGALAGEDDTGGVSSANYLEAIAAAHQLAVGAGDAKRSAKYARAMKIGARFIDQLTFKAADAYYCVTPRNAVGGVKNSTTDHAIRIDNCQHGLLALMAIREQLFPGSVKPKP